MNGSDNTSRHNVLRQSLLLWDTKQVGSTVEGGEKDEKDDMEKERRKDESGGNKEGKTEGRERRVRGNKGRRRLGSRGQGTGGNEEVKEEMRG